MVLRADAGPTIGLGHLRRCLTLAEALRARGADVVCVVTDEPRAVSVATSAGVPVATVAPGEAERLDRTRDLVHAWSAALAVVDTYLATEAALEEPVAPVTAVIDDLADRRLSADCVVNPSVGAEALPYRVGPSTRKLLGPRYALIRQAFARHRREVVPVARRLVVALGGGDPHGLVPVVASGVAIALKQVAVDIALGPFVQIDARLKETVGAAGGRITIHHQVPDMVALAQGADIAVTGGGQTTLELAAAGTPAVAIQIAENQGPMLSAMAERGVLIVAGVGTSPDVGAAVIREVVALSGDAGRRRAMAAAGPALVDGCGADRVASELLTLCGDRR